jgi:hypothetical protein
MPPTPGSTPPPAARPVPTAASTTTAPKPEVSRLAPMLSRVQKITPRLCISTEGFDGTGKSRFALSAPKPLGYYILDRGFEDPDEGVRDALQLDRVEAGVYRYNRSGGSEADLKDGAQEALSALKKDLRESIASKRFRSYAIDTADEVWEILRLARYGRLEKIPPMLYGPLNQEYRAAIINDFLRDVGGHGVNVIWVHKMKKEYRNKIVRKANGEESEVGEWTGRYERAGFKGFTYDAPNRLVHSKDLTVPVGQGRFSLTVTKCINAGLEGMVLPELDFPGFASMVFPQVDYEHWTK